MKTLKDMSGEELESKFLDLMPLGRVSEFRLELRRRLELAGRIEGRHLVALRNAVHATMPEGELCGDDALEAWPDKLRERAEKAEAERDTLNNALDSVCAEFPEYGNTSGHEAAGARCVELITELKAERDQARAESAAMRFKIHTLEQHNQHFERCESAWCHPSDKPWGNPALETFKGAKERAEIAEGQLSTARTALQTIFDSTVMGHDFQIRGICELARAALASPEAAKPQPRPGIHIDVDD